MPKPIKILFLANSQSIHTKRWVSALSTREYDVLLVSQDRQREEDVIEGVRYKELPFKGNIGYFLNAFILRKIIKEYCPDILNAHYASGYGTTASLVGFHPTLLSVWGSDVFDFPYESSLKASLLRWNLRRADHIASTSNVMARQVNRLMQSTKHISVTPFGVDLTKFKQISRTHHHDFITIGTVKTLHQKYGIDTLIDAFTRLRCDADIVTAGYDTALRLLIVGGGPDFEELVLRAKSAGIDSVTTFAGTIQHHFIPEWLNKLDIYVAMSRLDSESFGVAAVEASACARPVVVSDAGGLPEVVLNNETGFVVPRNNIQELYLRLKQLVFDCTLRERMGNAGRKHVEQEYDWEKCVDNMVSVYSEVIHRHMATDCRRR